MVESTLLITYEKAPVAHILYTLLPNDLNCCHPESLLIYGAIRV